MAVAIYSAVWRESRTIRNQVSADLLPPLRCIFLQGLPNLPPSSLPIERHREKSWSISARVMAYLLRVGMRSE